MSMRSAVFATVVAMGVLIVSAAGALAQPQTAAQQKCVNALNKDGVAVVKEQGKENAACLKGAGTAKLVGTAQACLTADAKGKVQKKETKTAADDAKLCGTAPSFGYTGAAAVNAAAGQGAIDLVADLFGADLDAAVVACTTSKAGCGCQQKVLGAAQKLGAVKLGEFLKCKKATLATGGSSAAALRACVDDAGTPGSIAADTKGKVAKAAGKLAATVVKACDTPGVTAGAFPGACPALTGAALGDCLDRQVECRTCQILNEMDGLFVNCDLFDDGLANATCDSGTGPTPTPTPTATPTPSATPTFPPGQIYVGAISKTSGLWNYDGVNGQPGGELECNDHFPGSHLCTFAELEAAEAAGQLAGAIDVDGQTVTSFWAVIPTDPGAEQCVSDPNVVNGIRWFYATAHFNSKARFATLNNGTGELSDLSALILCVAGFHSVACCAP